MKETKDMDRWNSTASTERTDESVRQNSVFMKQNKEAVTSASVNTTSPQNKKKTFSQHWTTIVKCISNPVLQGILLITRASAVNPKTAIASVVLISILSMVIGIFTNFEIVTDEGFLWTPMGSYPAAHLQWIDNESGFPQRARTFSLIFHESGATDILTKENVNKIFQTLDAIRALDDYDAVCSRDVKNNGVCDIAGITKFWNHSSAIFAANVETDTDLLEQMSVSTYSFDGTPVTLDGILGNYVRDNTTGVLVSAQNYGVTIDFPQDSDGDNVTSEAFETEALDVVFAFQDQWENEELKVEVFADRSFSDEFGRSIVKDIPLVPIVFVIMGIFTCMLFFKRDKVQSRSLLGFMSVVSILLSIMAAYGLMFICAIPFTSMTQILPFVFFGVGLDDAFIITGSFFRLDPTIDTIERITIVTDEIGLSIFLTTLTSALAFGLGCTSSIPAVYWLCLYAVPTVILILLFQLTFFIGCLVLDERRIQANNRDAFRCISCGKKQESIPTPTEVDATNAPLDRFMYWLVQQLLVPWVKVVIILAFIGLAVACGISTSNLRQEFDFTEVLPADSYIAPFFDALQDYSVRSSISPYVYFRNVDQSNAEIQKQMDTFVTNLVTIDSIISEPDFFWLRDFQAFVLESSNTTNDVTQFQFNDQLSTFLSDPLYYKLYNDNIIRDGSGNVLASRCLMYMDDVDFYDVKDQVKALNDQQRIASSQPINNGLRTLSFFTYDANYNIWQFFDQSRKEIRGTTICGIVAVSFAALVFIPHWSAILFAFPLACVLYIDFLGFLQWFGIKVNPVTYVTIVMAIGLMVDYLLHVLLRYYETPGNRTEKVVQVIRSMGASVMLGGVTTFLGTIPLAFSTSEIFRTVFIAFISLVVLGISHGLILLPVLLSVIGPEEQIYMGSQITASTSPTTSAAEHQQPSKIKKVEEQCPDDEDDEEMYA